MTEAAAVPSSEIATDEEAIEPELDDIRELIQQDLLEDDAELVEEALVRLAELLPIDEEAKSADRWRMDKRVLIPLGLLIVSHVLRAMKKFQRLKGIQMLGCECLSRFLFACKVEDRMHEHFADFGGLEIILSVIKLFPESADAHASASLTLENLFEPLKQNPVPKKIHDASCRFVEKQNGLDLVKKSMKKFPDESCLQPWWCGVLDSLATKKEFREAMDRANLLSLVAKARDTHREHHWVKQYSIGFMEEMWPRITGDEDDQDEEPDGKDEESGQQSRASQPAAEAGHSDSARKRRRRQK